ncbi:hypothetical protein LOK74_05455 [Brevibacillus humidisoli]|uniref:hypothetical protein n=1 Tax=Brevibacillus humidisoli TaxID=2895522 RepID=UPI001E34FC34|nr:hypothetical protein [Brevibacillus humidisoli]UFJ41950.1 hypothetical protein LOK74_05455 [Brevibacillus humidisoli]
MKRRARRRHRSRWRSIDATRRKRSRERARARAGRRRRRAASPRRANQARRRRQVTRIRSGVQVRRRKQRERILIARYYRPIQKMMLRKGYQVTIGQLKRVPLKESLSYVRDHFSPEVIARYMPLKRVFRSSEAQSGAFTPTTEEGLAKTGQPSVTTVRTVVKRPARSAKRSRRSRIRQRLWAKRRWSEPDELLASPSTLTPVEPNETPRPAAATPLIPYLDINQPAPLTEEVSSSAAETQKVNNIFTFSDSHPFDPGLWSMVMGSLPQGYIIPDSNFTSRLEQAQSEVVNAHLSGQVEPLNPDSV